MICASLAFIPPAANAVGAINKAAANAIALAANSLCFASMVFRSPDVWSLSLLLLRAAISRGDTQRRHG